MAGFADLTGSEGGAGTSATQPEARGHWLMRRIARRVLALGLLAAAGPLTGCQTVTTGDRIDPGLTGYSTILGCAAQRFVFPLPVVERAAVEAMTTLGIHSVRKSLKGPGYGPIHHAHEGDQKPPEMVVLNGNLYDGRFICMELEPQGEATGVRIRVDMYGDEPFSKLLLDHMAVRLATMPQSVIPPFDPRTLSDGASHRGMQVEGYRGAPLR
jgi:hypothetical protein